MTLNPSAFDFNAPPSRDKSLIETGRPAVEHKHLFPEVYKYIWPIYFSFMVFGRSIRIFAGLFFGTSFIFGFSLLSLAIGLIPAFISAYFEYHGLINTLLKSEVGHEFDASRPSARAAPHFKDASAINRLWSISHNRAALLTHAARAQAVDPELARKALLAAQKDPSDPDAAPVASWDRPDFATFYQPVEGYCAPATLNTLLYSVPGCTIVPTKRFPGPATLDQFANTIKNDVPALLPKGMTVKSVSAHQVDGDKVDFAAFRSLLSRAQAPRTRVLINFLRQPLFGTFPSSLFYRARALVGGHWSPVFAVSPSTAVPGQGPQNPDEELALVSDVNAGFGPCTFNLRRLYDACRTKDGAKFRGVVVVEFDGPADGLCEEHLPTSPNATM